MAKNTTLFERNPTMVQFISFIIVLVVNAITIAVANMFFPTSIVLGTMSLSYNWALFLSSSVISAVTVFALPFMYEIGHYKNRDLMPAELLSLYLLVNIICMWLITRAADVFGLGVSSWVVLLVITFILNFLQGMAMLGFDVFIKRMK